MDSLSFVIMFSPARPSGGLFDGDRRRDPKRPETDPERAMDDLHERMLDPVVRIVGD